MMAMATSFPWELEHMQCKDNEHYLIGLCETYCCIYEPIIAEKRSSEMNDTSCA